jgi:hypothetical protein
MVIIVNANRSNQEYAPREVTDLRKSSPAGSADTGGRKLTTAAGAQFYTSAMKNRNN